MEEAKRARNLLQRKLKEEGSSHNAEKKALQRSQTQCERRELTTKYQLQQVEKELLNNQRVSP